MIPVILCAVICGVLSFQYCSTDRNYEHHTVAGIIAWTTSYILLGSAVGTGIGAGLGIAAGVTGNTACVNPVDTRLQSLNGAPGTVGSFVDIDQSYTFHYFTKTDGHYDVHDASGYLVTIYDDATRDTAHATEWKTEATGVWKWFVVGAGGWGCKIELHVPTGTVVNQYEARP